MAIPVSTINLLALSNPAWKSGVYERLTIIIRIKGMYKRNSLGNFGFILLKINFIKIVNNINIAKRTVKSKGCKKDNLGSPLIFPIETNIANVISGYLTKKKAAEIPDIINIFEK